MVDFETLLRGPVYATLGILASLSRGAPALDVDIRVLDKTTPQAGADAVAVADFHPHCKVRVSELEAAGVLLTELDGSTLTFGAVTWEIVSHERDPRGGAVILNLTEA